MAQDSTCDPMDRLMTTLRVRLPGVTDAMLEVELFNTIDEFFRRTNAWRYEDDIVLTEGEMEYEIDPPENSVMVRVMRMWHGDIPMEPYDYPDEGGTGMTSRGLITPIQTWADGDALFHPDKVISPSNVLRYSIFFPKYIALDLPPTDQAAKKLMRVAMSLSLAQGCKDCGGLDFPEWMHAAYFEAWLDGAQLRLMSQIGKPYSNPIYAEYHGRRFRNKMAFHKQEAERGFVYDKPNWRFPVGGFVSRYKR